MMQLFTAVAQAATDTVETVAATLPALPKDLASIPPEVWEKLSSGYVYSLLQKAMKSPWEEVVDNLVPIFFFLLVGFAIWLFVKLRSKRNTEKHEENMAMIEKGIYEPLPEQKAIYRKERYLLAGIVLSMVGLAFLLSFAFALREEGMIIASFLFLFPGLGLLGFYRSLAKREEREERNNVLSQQKNPPA